MITSSEEQAALFRPLTPEELQVTSAAMKFLYYKKHISIENIRYLKCYSLDYKKKTIKFIYDTKYFKILRSFSYANTPLEDQVKALPSLHSRFRIFPAGVWTKRKIWGSGVPIFSENEVRQILGLRPKWNIKKIDWNKSEKQVIIRINR